LVEQRTVCRFDINWLDALLFVISPRDTAFEYKTMMCPGLLPRNSLLWKVICGNKKTFFLEEQRVYLSTITVYINRFIVRRHLGTEREGHKLWHEANTLARSFAPNANSAR
jgi:hypothetical protein